MIRKAIITTILALVCTISAWSDTTDFQNIDVLLCDFTIPTGLGIHTVTVDIVVDTSSESWTSVDLDNLSFELTHTGASATILLPDNPSNFTFNYNMDLSGNGNDDDGGVNVKLDAVVIDSSISLILTANPDSGFPLGDFSSGWDYDTTETWTFTITGFSDRIMNVTSRAFDTTTELPANTIDILIPTVSLELEGIEGTDYFTGDIEGEYLVPAGQNVDFNCTFDNPFAPGESFTWDFNNSGTVMPTDDVQNPAAYTLDAVPADEQIATYTIVVTMTVDDNGRVATNSCILHVKKPPQTDPAPPSGLRISSPITDPPWGDGPLLVEIETEVQNDDPFTEEVDGGDTDVNDTDYTLSWQVDGTEFASGNSNDPSPHTTSYTFPATETGARNIELIITDDYNQSSSFTSDNIYVAPLDNMNFPPTVALPGEPGFPIIDGVLVPTDTDGDGSLEGNGDDTIEMGWHNAFRVSFASGTDEPVAVQALRPADTATSPYLYLSFEVNHDPTFDNDDVVVITFRPDRSSSDPADDRRLFIFPVHNDTGAGGGAAGSRHFSQPLRNMQVYRNSDNWVDVTSGITEATTEADPGFFARVHSFEAGVDNYSWHIELRVPTGNAEGGTDWIEFKDDFLFYANVIRVSDRTDAFGGTGYGTQFRWPRNAPWAVGNLEDSGNFLPWQWGGARQDTAFGESAGVFFSNWSDIGILDGTDIVNSITVDTDPFTIPMAARVHSNAESDIGDVQVLFRVANWGATLLEGGNWTEIPAVPPTVNPSEAMTVAAEGSSVAQMDWELSSGDGFFEHFRDVQDHQCVYAEITTANGNILRKSYWNNMTFQVSSTVTDTAEISTVGAGDPPAGRQDHRVILEIVRKEWTETHALDQKEDHNGNQITGIDPVSGASLIRLYNAPASEDTDSFLEYQVYASYDTGASLVINGNNYAMFEPIASFGYVFYHDDEVRKWLDTIENAEKINDSLYVVNIPEESELVINLEVESKEPLGLSAGLRAGSAIPIDRMTNDYWPGTTITADFGWEVSPGFTLNGLVGFSYLFARNSGSQDMTVVNLSANLRYFFVHNGGWNVFIGGGPGMYVQDSDIAAGINAGAGAIFDLNPLLALELVVNYHCYWISGIPAQYTTQEVGIRYSF